MSGYTRAQIEVMQAALIGPEDAVAGPGRWETRWRCAYCGEILTAWEWPAPAELEQRRVAESDIVEHLRQARACRGKPAVLRRGSSRRPAVAVAVVVRAGRVLLVRRRVQEAGFSWGFVGGEVESGETPKEAAVRELREEVGLEAGATARIGQRLHPQSGRRLIYVACGEVAGEARLRDREELAEMAWCTLEELDQRIPSGIFTPVREHLERMLKRAKN